MTGAGQEATGTPQPNGRGPADPVARPAQDQPAISLADDVAAGDVAAAAATAPSLVDATRFAHASEAEMARILDFYDVRWEYEPTTFPILWNLEGEVVESFAPDFYLPELGVFLEMTTLKQRLVRKKNRKLRRLRELYPDIRIKLFYARDFRAMMLKYGRLGLAESLSGTLGQVVPERAATIDAVEPIVPPELAIEVPEPVRPARPAKAIALDPKPSRATPRSRSSRRRRRGGAVTENGAEREAGA